MKALWLVLWLATATAQAAVASGTLALYKFENDLTDSSGNGYTLSQNGTLTFHTTPTPPQGAYAVGGFSGAVNGYSAALRTAASGSTTYTFEAYIYVTDLSTQRMIWSGGSSSASSIFFSVLNTGAIRWTSDDANIYDSTAGDIAVNTWYYVAFVVNGTSLKVYKGLPGVAPSLVKDVTATSPESPTAGNFYLGAYSLATGIFNFSGYIDAVRFSNVARTSLPTSDSSGSLLSPYPDQSNKPFVSPLWWMPSW